MTPLHSAVFCIGDFRVDPALDEISQDGVTAKPAPRTMQLLFSYKPTVDWEKS